MVNRLLTTVLAVAFVVLSTGCGDQAKRAAVEADLEAVRVAVLEVPGISGGDITVNNPGSFSSLYFTCALTSDAEDREELLATLDDIGQVIAETAAPDTEAVVQCKLANDVEEVELRDLGIATGSISAIKEHYQG